MPSFHQAGCCCLVDDTEVIEPCIDCAGAQPDAIVTTTGIASPCDADGTYEWHSFSDGHHDEDKGDFCLWRWELDNGGIDWWNLVVIYWEDLDQYAVSIYWMVTGQTIYRDEPADVECDPGVLVGTAIAAGLVADLQTCVGRTATIVLGGG